MLRWMIIIETNAKHGMTSISSISMSESSPFPCRSFLARHLWGLRPLYLGKVFQTCTLAIRRHTPLNFRSLFPHPSALEWRLYRSRPWTPWGRLRSFLCINPEAPNSRELLSKRKRWSRDTAVSKHNLTGLSIENVLKFWLNMASKSTRLYLSRIRLAEVMRSSAMWWIFFNVTASLGFWRTPEISW